MWARLRERRVCNLAHIFSAYLYLIASVSHVLSDGVGHHNAIVKRQQKWRSICGIRGYCNLKPRVRLDVLERSLEKEESHLQR